MFIESLYEPSMMVRLGLVLTDTTRFRVGDRDACRASCVWNDSMVAVLNRVNHPRLPSSVALNLRLRIRLRGRPIDERSRTDAGECANHGRHNNDSGARAPGSPVIRITHIVVLLMNRPRNVLPPV